MDKYRFTEEFGHIIDFAVSRKLGLFLFVIEKTEGNEKGNDVIIVGDDILNYIISGKESKPGIKEIRFHAELKGKPVCIDFVPESEEKYFTILNDRNNLSLYHYDTGKSKIVSLKEVLRGKLIWR